MNTKPTTLEIIQTTDTELSVADIYISFNQWCYKAYTDKIQTDYLDKDSETCIEEHNKQLSSILADTIGSNIPEKVIFEWVLSIGKKIDRMQKIDSNSYYNTGGAIMKKNITKILDSANPYFSMYRSHYLPLEEKLALQRSVALLGSASESPSSKNKPPSKI